MSKTYSMKRPGKGQRHDQKPNTRAPRPDWNSENEKPRRHVRALGQAIRPMNDGQRGYDAAIRSNDVIFATGPAGTGKTFFAAARAAEAFLAGDIARIIITRPNVEAAEDGIGYLPGELEEKFEPYFRPVREALEKVLGSGPLEYAIKSGQIEARPLAFLRGATLEDAWVIGDEMQNATRSQMKLLLSRAGENVKFLINGDEDQLDIDPAKSGLMDAVRRLRSIPRIDAVAFTDNDIVRSSLCQAIVRAYSNNSSATPLASLYIKTAANEDDRAGLERTLSAA